MAFEVEFYYGEDGKERKRVCKENSEDSGK